MKTLKTAAKASILLAFTSTASTAAIIGPASTGGSELILSLVNNTTNASLSIDLGRTIDQLAIGDVFSLNSTAQEFIATGGLDNISYGVIAGDTSNFNTNVFLTSSTRDLTAVQVANATKGTWGNSIIQLTGNLNAGDGSGTEVNNTYGPFADGLGSPNYTNGGHDDWQTGVANLSNLALGSERQNLYRYTLTGFIGTQTAEQFLAPIELSGDSLSIVPIPAAVWLFGSALLGMFGAGRRQAFAEVLAGLKARLTLNELDLRA